MVIITDTKMDKNSKVPPRSKQALVMAHDIIDILLDNVGKIADY